MPPWSHPANRGLYTSPGLNPPPPQPHETNNLSNRIVRIETYLQHAVSDRLRAETESLHRDRYLVDQLKALQAEVAVWSDYMRAAALAARWGLSAAKIAGAGLVFALWSQGALTWQELWAVVGPPLRVLLGS